MKKRKINVIISTIYYAYCIVKLRNSYFKIWGLISSHAIYLKLSAEKLPCSYIYIYSKSGKHQDQDITNI
jgi:hypothetical protein